MAGTSDHSEASDSLQHTELVTEALVRLQVGERHFTTMRDTLTEESAFFAALLSGRWDNALDDGSYFIDADPALFEHILRYLRRGIFPLFFDVVKGHDYHLYVSLLEEARYFQITRLENWLERKRYLDAVQVAHTADQYHDDYSSWAYLKVPSGVTVEHYPQWAIRKVYICPRGIPGHRGSPMSCGRRCAAAQGDNDDIYEEEPYLKMLVLKKTVTFRPEVCVARDI
ncbi:hypothetical protein N657DRAFT_626804 [Parathielavia appendiculata]|uniref:BTB domain-containing protein n=1 Tax=Parathielavia appendiculata TaxID=2587402 RepID=A0AAN6TSQ4_9PEZI|nr:hypothetical protein N657DRAFT_626804 [Parathielavia appendiculata]